MGKFTTLTDRQQKLVRELVDLSRNTHVECFVFADMDDDGRAFTPHGASTRPLPGITDGIYSILADAGLLVITHFSDQCGRHNWNLTLPQRAYDYVDYLGYPSCRRWWANLCWDLAHDDTVRSKFLWALGTLILSQIGTIIMILLGWI